MTNDKANNKKTNKKVLKTPTTEVVFILDRSSSMGGLESETIDGYNKTLAKQRELSGETRVTTVLFDNRSTTIIDRVDLNNVKPMTHKDYRVQGCTALLDAMGETIHHINKLQKTDFAGRPDHTIFVITTDGMENASHTYTLKKVRNMVEKRRQKNNWEFLFLGANIDAIETAENLGIPRRNAATYLSDSRGTAVMHEAVGNALEDLSFMGCIDGDWKAIIEEDVASR